MHALDVWQAPEVQLRIFTLYSPLHLVIYAMEMHRYNGLSRFSSMILSSTLMALISAQTFAIVFLYSGLVKDKAVIAGEVLNEYNQKFVMPRAMPVCRDASTMTTQAETITDEDFQEKQSSRPASSSRLAKTSASSVASSASKRSRKSKSTAT